MDALRIYLPPDEVLDPTFKELRHSVKRESGNVEDYRPHGLPLVLVKPDARHGAKELLIIDFIGVGKMWAEDIVEYASRVVKGDPLGVRVGRVDFCADWFGGSMSLCRNSLNVRLRRTTPQYLNRNSPANEVEKLRHEPGSVETMYFGSLKSDNFYRLYNKSAERQQARKNGGATDNVEVPPYWVRLERRVSGRSLPEKLRTLGGLLGYGHLYRPFDNVTFQPRPLIEIQRLLDWKATPNERRNVIYTQLLLHNFGEAGARKILSGENRKPTDQLALLDRAITELGINTPNVADFNDLYQTAFRWQMPGWNPRKLHGVESTKASIVV